MGRRVCVCECIQELHNGLVIFPRNVHLVERVDNLTLAGISSKCQVVSIICAQTLDQFPLKKRCNASSKNFTSTCSSLFYHSLPHTCVPSLIFILLAVSQRNGRMMRKYTLHCSSMSSLLFVHSPISLFQPQLSFFSFIPPPSLPSHL